MIKKHLPVFSAGLMLTLSPKLASAVQSGADLASAANIGKSLLALLLVLAIFFGCARLLRKSGAMRFLNQGQLGVVAGLSLGMREKLVLVKVGEKQLLLGVTSGRIDKLMELEGDQRLFHNPAELGETGAFEKKLMQFMQGKQDA
ncbi:MAG: flagellar biosynthetic protein FliO [Methylomonas sp.]